MAAAGTDLRGGASPAGKWRERGRGLLLSLLSLVLLAAVAETVLNSGRLDDLDNPAPIWIPPHLEAVNQEVLVANYVFSRGHPHGFTDRPRPTAKPTGTVRVAVVGDSFVWGDGLPWAMTWGHRLERMLRRRYTGVEVLSWGRNGWSTLDQARFLARHGMAWEPDLVLVGFVTNDPDLHEIPLKRLTWHESAAYGIIARVVPNLASFFADHLNAFLRRYLLLDHGYERWVDRLYGEANLARYGRVLELLAELCRRRGAALAVVMTPPRCGDDIRDKYHRVGPLFDRAGIARLDLLPVVCRRFGDVNPRHLWANPANGHPGPALQALYARRAAAFIDPWLRDAGARPRAGR